MPRYLQKLVARAGVAPLLSSLRPTVPVGAQVGGPDPFREVESFHPDTSAPREPEARVTPFGPVPEPPRAIEFPANPIPRSQPVVHERTTEHIIENRVEPRFVPNQEALFDEMRPPSEVRVQTSGQLQAPHVEPKLAEAIVHAVPPLVTVAGQSEETENAPREMQLSEPPPSQKHAPEPDVLSKLMPRLEAWFKQPSRTEAKVEELTPEPRLGPPSRELQNPPPLREEEPRLVIGQIRVDVVQTPPPAAVPVPRVVTIQARSGQSPANVGTVAKLGFGLGQM